MSYYPAFICENGHEINTLSTSCSDSFCTKCGARIISKCPDCNGQIRGRLNDGFGFMVDYIVPSYCPHCGKPYPWTRAAIQSTIYLLEDAEEIPNEDRVRLIKVLPDVVAETPMTKAAAVRMRKVLDSAGELVSGGLKDFVVGCACETFKHLLGF